MHIQIYIAELDPIQRYKWFHLLQQESDFAIMGKGSTWPLEGFSTSLSQPHLILAGVELLEQYNVISTNPSNVEQTATRILLTTSTPMATKVLQHAMSCGVHGCILRNEPFETVLLAIHSVVHGAFWFSASLLTNISDLFVQPCLLDRVASESFGLTRREIEVLKLLAQGLSNKVIAIRLQLVERTVEFHITNILRKLQLGSRVEAIIWAKDPRFAPAMF